ncbi:TPA: hypothetical protein ACGO1T_001181 [Streptococcus suis]
MFDIYFDDKLIHREQFIKDYLRYSKPVAYAVDWDAQCEMVARAVYFGSDNFYTLRKDETKDGFEHSFEFRLVGHNMEYVGCF